MELQLSFCDVLDRFHFNITNTIGTTAKAKDSKLIHTACNENGGCLVWLSCQQFALIARSLLVRAGMFYLYFVRVPLLALKVVEIIVYKLRVHELQF